MEEQPSAPQPNASNASTPGSGEGVEDIFANLSNDAGTSPPTTPVAATEPPPLRSPIPATINNVPPPRESTLVERSMGRGTKVRLILLAVAVVFALVATGLAYWVKNRPSDAPSPGQIEQLEDTTPVQNPVRNTTPSTAPVVDSDGDGLLDTEEAEYNTDPLKVDTDLDGLTDRQEVRVHMTDPLAKDTDKDGFTDGEEVRNFYNPNGPGKLLDVVDEINKFEEEQAQ